MERQRALLIGANLNNQADFQETMEELENLAIACNLEIVGRVEQNLQAVNTAYYIGSGKVKEIKSLLDEAKVDILVFDHELSPSQLRNLERALECEVLDRTALILEIFAQRAKTKEAKLQVEVARLQYLLPRLVGSYEFLGRQVGGVGTITRGAGEKKLDLDRRKIEQKISELNKELERVENKRKTQRKKRNKSGLPKVAIVGYTNAGKSTLMNALIGLSNKSAAKQVLVKDMLFATLDTTVRKITLPDNKEFILSDTVGFVSKLPHNLVKTFRSTLEEVREADLLLHVVDLSNPHYHRQMEVTEKTLIDIGAGDIPIIYVYNKADLTQMKIPFIDNQKIYISAKEKIGIVELSELIAKMVFKQYIECKMLIPFEHGKVLYYLNENAHIKSVSYRNNGTLLTLECKESDYKRFERFAYVE